MAEKACHVFGSATQVGSTQALGLMEIAPRIELAISSNEAAPPSDLIVGMRIAAGTKNPYRIYFPKTDVNGRTALERAAVIGQFKDHWEEGLMDFNGTLESAPQTVTFFLFDTGGLQANLDSSLAWPLLAHERTVWRSRQDKVSYFLSCRNNQYSLRDTVVVVPTDGLLRLQVHRR